MLPPLPRLVIGTARMGSLLPDALASRSARARAFAFLDGLVEMGCSAFDLAASYMLGGTERLFGAWMASRRNRDRLVLVTKGGHPVPLVAPHRLGRRALTDDLHGSLARLRVERVDLYLLHKDDPAEPLESILQTLTSFHGQGKIAAWGVSNWTHQRIAELAALALSAGVPGPSASSPHFSLFAWTAEPWPGSVSIAGDAGVAARAYYEGAKLPCLAWSPLAGGFAAGNRAAGGRRRGVYACPANEGRLRRAEALANKRGRTATQVALAYLFHQPFPVSAVVAARSSAHVHGNLEAAALALSEAEARWLESGAGPAPA